MALSKEFISFIIPVYNTNPNMLDKSIQSIQNQGFENYEIIIVNDGSSTTSVEDRCKSYVQVNRKVKYLFQENQGSAVARNTGLDYASGDYIFFVDADDSVPDNFGSKLEKISTDFDVLCFDYEIVFPEKKRQYTLLSEYDLSNRKSELYGNIMYAPEVLENFMFGAIWGKCFSKNFLDANNIRFRPELRKTQDRVFMLDVCFNAEKIYYLPILSYEYVINQESITHKINFKMIDYYYVLYQTIKEFCDKHGVDEQCSKFFTYSIFNEMLQLTYFNSQYNGNGIQRRDGILQLYEKFGFCEELRRLKVSDFSSMKGKVKLILFKLNAFSILNYYFSRT